MRFVQTLAATLALGVAALSFAGSAQAGDDWRWHRGGGWYHDDWRGDAVGAGVLGFGVGAVVGGALAAPAYYPEPYYYAPAPVYVAPRYAPAPVYVAPSPVVVYEPWTPRWVHYCEVRYRTFDPGTGYFIGNGGVRRFCR